MGPTPGTTGGPRGHEGPQEAPGAQERLAAPTTPRKSSRRLPTISVNWLDRPVILPPGRARLATRPVPRGSATATKTIGMTDVACFAARTGGVPVATMTSTKFLKRAQSSASSHGGKCSLQTRRRSSTYRLSCVRELISITRVQTRSTRDHRPMLGDYGWSCGSWSLYSATGNIPMALSEAIIATYMTIHIGPIPRFTQWENCRLPARSSGRERKSCGCGFQATKARVR